MNNDLTIYCDGSYSHSLKLGAWGVVIMYHNHTSTRCGKAKKMDEPFDTELKALGKAISACRNIHADSTTIFTDNKDLAKMFNAYKSNGIIPNDNLWVDIMRTSQLYKSLVVEWLPRDYNLAHTVAYGALHNTIKELGDSINPDIDQIIKNLSKDTDQVIESIKTKLSTGQKLNGPERQFMNCINTCIRNPLEV